MKNRNLSILSAASALPADARIFVTVDGSGFEDYSAAELVADPKTPRRDGFGQAYAVGVFLPSIQQGGAVRGHVSWAVCGGEDKPRFHKGLQVAVNRALNMEGLPVEDSDKAFFAFIGAFE